MLCCSCVACVICVLLCKRFSDFGKREREPGESLEREREIVVVTLATRAWRVTRKLGDFGRERESAWRITRKHWTELERKWAGWQGAA